MRVLGLDPGPTQSALVILGDRRVLWHWIEPNMAILERVAYFAAIQIGGKTGLRVLDDELVIEQVANMGMPAVGDSMFETARWGGRFEQAWHSECDVEAHRLKRHEVKMHLCGNMRAKDANIRQALIDRFGGDSAIGRKHSKGPLYGLRGDEWAALAVALTWQDKVAQKAVGCAREAKQAHA